MPNFNFDIIENTDSRGDDKWNQQLSERRAVRVENYLILKGVLGTYITMKGSGEDHPLSENDSEKGRKLNR
jgi:OmpA-OmpF porin, OOP family